MIANYLVSISLYIRGTYNIDLFFIFQASFLSLLFQPSIQYRKFIKEQNVRSFISGFKFYIKLKTKYELLDREKQIVNLSQN